MSFYVKENESGDETRVIAAGGELDLSAVPDFKRALADAIEQAGPRLIVDLSAVTFIASTEIGMLVAAATRLREAGGSLLVVCTDENILRVFEIAGLTRVLPIYDSCEDALAGVARVA